MHAPFQIDLFKLTFTAQSGANNGIESVKKNSPLGERSDRRESKKGEPYFVLLAGNRQVIGQSEIYSSSAAMENSIASVKKNGSDASINDLK